MSSILVGAYATQIHPGRLSLNQTIACVVRDVVLLAWHLALLLILINPANSNDVHDIDYSCIIPWLLIDIGVSGLRLLKTPIQYIANQRLQSNGANWNNPMDLSRRWERWFGPALHLGNLYLYTVIDWLTYISWIIGLCILDFKHEFNYSSSSVEFASKAVYFEMYSSRMVFTLWIFVILAGFQIHEVTKGRCFPGCILYDQEWPNMCPSVSFDRSQWRRPNEPLEEYRERVTANFLLNNMQPQGIEMVEPYRNMKLTEAELNELKIFPFSSTVLKRDDSVRSTISLNRKPTITRIKSTTKKDTLDDTKLKRTLSRNLPVLEKQGRRIPNENNSLSPPDKTELQRRLSFQRDRETLSVSNITQPKSSQTERTTDETCALCLEDYEEGEMIRELFCLHRYHAECVDEWLTTTKRTCPVCNADACGQSERTSTESSSTQDHRDYDLRLLR
ncbi:hypothetical protein BC833DRAFT_584630 [Globomyces pollinis-pini]|nr:hypothetical protein BC833DRAFT_584630 [Globomyces pollinis-pini]KAJ2994735.1 E3 ubiquitin-protein ligase rnf13 [Globomyces sp. JEL0801]